MDIPCAILILVFTTKGRRMTLLSIYYCMYVDDMIIVGRHASGINYLKFLLDGEYDRSTHGDVQESISTETHPFT